MPKRHEPMIWEFNGYGGIIAIRDGKWKGVKRGLKSKKDLPWELYNIDSDRNETKDVASEHPEIIQRLEKNWLKTRTTEPDFKLPRFDKKN